VVHVRLSKARYAGVLVPKGPTSDDSRPNDNVVAPARLVKSTVVHSSTTKSKALFPKR
jgi:hypothetical protein